MGIILGGTVLKRQAKTLGGGGLFPGFCPDFFTPNGAL
jgi:hypothetical protein